MTPLTLAQIRTLLHAKPAALPQRTVERVSTDTRTVVEGDLFIALSGDSFDAHDFLDKATHAAAAIVERVPVNAPAELPLIVVPNARKALGELARMHRRALKHTKVIAVAGSNGKTGTKHLIHAALSGHLRGTASPKSFNNDIGVPLTLLPVVPRDDYVIVECGTNHPGEIEALSKIAEPDIAVITGIGAEHLEGLGDLNGVRRENAAISVGMSRQGLLIVNGDDKGLAANCASYGGKRVTFGLESRNDLFATDIICDADGVRFKLNGSRVVVTVPLLGRHNASNALAAIAVARRLGVPDAKMLAGLAQVIGPEMRMQRIDVGGIRLINDAYNANPQSMEAALITLRDFPNDGRKIAILGDMLELGTESDRFHRDAGQQAATYGADVLICVGPGGSLLAAAAVRAGVESARVWSFPDSIEAARDVPAMLRTGDLVLLKASRGMRLERIAEAIAKRCGEDPAMRAA